MNVKELFSLDGKVAVVTGGSIGLGYQMASAMAEQGANVVVAARKLERCEEAAQGLEKEFGIKALPMKCDVRNFDDCRNLIAAAKKEFGTVDIMINNAGFSWGFPTLDYPIDKFEDSFRINTISAYVCASEAAKIMIEKGNGGKIINIASIGGMQGAATLEAVGYSASKGAVISMTRELGVKLAKHRINVNAILPGWFITHMTDKFLKAGDRNAAIPAERYGGDSDLKGAAVLLASRASDYMVGHMLVVDGGVTAW